MICTYKEFYLSVEKARKVGLQVRHCSDLKINSDEASNYIDDLIALLSDQKCLNSNTEARTARNQLTQVINYLDQISRKVYFCNNRSNIIMAQPNLHFKASIGFWFFLFLELFKRTHSL